MTNEFFSRVCQTIVRKIVPCVIINATVEHFVITCTHRKCSGAQSCIFEKWRRSRMRILFIVIFFTKQRGGLFFERLYEYLYNLLGRVLARHEIPGRGSTTLVAASRVGDRLRDKTNCKKSYRRWALSD